MTSQDRAAVPTTVDALTVDGGIVSIRPITSRDRRAVTRLYADASPENLRLRFFAFPGSAALAAEVDRLCRPESDGFLALLAYEGDRLVGVASCERAGDRPRAEFAVFIADHDHGRGIGTLLLEHLTARAHRLGVTELVGEVLPANRGMLRVAHDLSPQSWAHFDRGIVDVSLRTGDDERTRQAVDERDRIAERASLQPLFTPRAVAVVGADQSPGRQALHALRECGFTGRLYPVSRAGATLDEPGIHRSLRELPEPVDLLMIASPADQVADVLADGAANSARAAIVLSAGFGEAGAADRQRLADVLRLARSHGIRLVGPNSLGVVNTDPRVRLGACVVPVLPPAGGLGVAAQSPATAIAVLETAVRTGTGVSTLVALGDKADVSGDDLIAYWYDDPATRAVALYLESFGNPRKFARTAHALSLRKPVLAVGSACEPAGRAGGLHNAALEALFVQAGVIRPGTIGASLDAARMLTGQPLPAGDRLTVVSNTGGLCRLAADAAKAAGLRLPAMGWRSRRQLAVVASQALSADNPIDLGQDATPAAFAAATATVAAGDTATMLLIAIACTPENQPDLILAAIAPVVDRHPDLPVAVVVTGHTGDVAPELGKRHAPVYDSPGRAVMALAHAAAYAAWRRQPHGRYADLPDIDKDLACTMLGKAMAEQAGWQPPQLTAQILTAYGITISPATTTTGLRLPVRHHGGSPTELVAGVIHDPVFGALVLLGPGGPYAGRVDERVVRLAPMTVLDAEQMWRSLRCLPLLTGNRGTGPAVATVLEELLLRLGRLAEDHPVIAELGVSLLLDDASGLTVVDAELRLAAAGAEIDPLLRQLPSLAASSADMPESVASPPPRAGGGAGVRDEATAQP
jgi:acyl-CoA synthetase (NDP forming)/L-amino acid N-acyltransferase YncA